MVYNTLFVVSAPSGSGKTSLMRSVMSNEITSFTTRAIREKEVDGVDYIFITKEEFYKMKDNDDLIEFTEYDGNFYGISKSEYEGKMERGNAFAIVDYHGMQQFKDIHKKCVTIFILTSKEDAIANMFSRGDSFDSINKRVETYDDELLNRIHYDFVVTNEHGKFSETTGILHSITLLKG